MQSTSKYDKIINLTHSVIDIDFIKEREVTKQGNNKQSFPILYQHPETHKAKSSLSFSFSKERKQVAKNNAHIMVHNEGSQ